MNALFATIINGILLALQQEYCTNVPHMKESNQYNLAFGLEIFLTLTPSDCFTKDSGTCSLDIFKDP